MLTNERPGDYVTYNSDMISALVHNYFYERGDDSIIEYPLLLTKAVGDIYEQCSGVRELGIMHFYQKFKPKLPQALSGFLRLAIEWSIREELSYWPHDDFIGAFSCANESHIQKHYVIKRDGVSYIVPSAYTAHKQGVTMLQSDRDRNPLYPARLLSTREARFLKAQRRATSPPLIPALILRPNPVSHQV